MATLGNKIGKWRRRRRLSNLRERVSERERLYIAEHYYSATGDVEKEKETLESTIRTYPNESAAVANLALIYDFYLGEFEKAIQMANETIRLEPAAPFGYLQAGFGHMALNRLEEARTLAQRAVDMKADNHYVHALLFDVAFLNGDNDGMREQVKWSEGKPGEYYLLNFSANAAASHGQMKKADELIQRSVQVSNRVGFKETTSETQAAWALQQAEVGNVTKARELAAASAALARTQANLAPATVALAMTGDGNRAQAFMDELNHRFPADTILHRVNIPCVQALIGLNRNAPQQAIQALQAATPYELGINLGLLPIYIRGLAYLKARRGAEAAAEFQKIIAHRGVAPTFPEHSLARLGLGRAFVITGDRAKATATYQDFFALWKDADPDIPILKEAKAEYAKLQ
jgi:tetratricopeptide (TPR) repeat protein